MTEPTFSPSAASTPTPNPTGPPTVAGDAETITSYKKTFNLMLLTVARGWADRLSARPTKASWTGVGLLGFFVLGVNGWLDPATLQSLISGH